MTVGIAAIVYEQGLIVTVCDQMLSGNDLVQARDHAALKARKISSNWAVIFSGNGVLFVPFVDQAIKLSLDIGGNVDLKDIKVTLESLYRSTREEQFVNWHISKLGYKSVEEFRKSGLSELGDNIFGDVINELSKFELGINFIVFGHDENKHPHIFSLENPGVLVNHDLERFSVIGSGTYMARASLSRQHLPTSLNSVLYRVLGAKFSSETASGVGKGTSVIITDSNGEVSYLSKEVVDSVRAIWDREINAPDPSDAMEMISKSGGYLLATGQMERKKGLVPNKDDH